MAAISTMDDREHRTAGHRLKALALGLCAVLALSACDNRQSSRRAPVSNGGVIFDPSTTPPPEKDLTVLEDRLPGDVVRVDLLLPLSVPQRGAQRVAKALANAARMAERDLGDDRMILTIRDTGGSPDRAVRAAQAAIDGGAEIILGPLFSRSVAAVGPIADANGISVVAFSTDAGVASSNVFLLSFLPSHEVERVTRFAARQGHSQIALLAPDGAYGSRVGLALNDSAGLNGFGIPTQERYARDPNSMLKSVRNLRGVGMDAVVVPDNALSMRSVAPLFPYVDIELDQVRLLGTGLWDDPNIFEEPLMLGAWFASPDPAHRRRFIANYRDTYGATPPRISSLSYDAISLAGTLIGSGGAYPFSPENITDPNGFGGVDGIFRFRPDGISERGLAVLEIAEGGFQVVSPAPDSFVGAIF